MEGKELLLNIIEEYFNDIKEYDLFNYDLYNQIIENYDNFINVPNDYLNKSEKKVRDLLKGKIEYNIEANIDYTIITDFLTKLKKNVSPKLLIFEDVKDLKESVLENKLIRDVILIYDLIEIYDSINKEKDMLLITKYISENNLSIQKIELDKTELLGIKFVDEKIPEEILSILRKFEIDYNKLPSNIVYDLKHNNKNVITNYNLIRRNKVEDYGILHLIDKNNKLLLVSILLYCSDNSIKEVVDAVNTPSIDINSTKSIINNIPTVFYEKNYKNFINNINYLRELIVNYKVLINKEPLFLTIDNGKLNNVLDNLDKHGYIKRDVINKLYKTIYYDSNLILHNSDIIEELGIKKEVFLLKVNDLKDRITKDDDNYKNIISNLYYEVTND